jgi:hypothetical protein
MLLLLALFKDCQHCQPLSIGNLPPMGGYLPSALSQVDTFLAGLRQRRHSIVDKSLVRGRLIFGIDATASRQPARDTACQLQAKMFREATAVGGLEL